MATVTMYINMTGYIESTNISRYHSIHFIISEAMSQYIPLRRCVKNGAFFKDSHTAASMISESLGVKNRGKQDSGDSKQMPMKSLKC